MSDGRRIRRVEEAVRAHVAGALQTDVRDQRLAGLVITRIEVTADLGIARVGVRMLAGDDSERARDDVLRALRRAAGRLRHGLGTKIRMKKTPELRFHYDAGHDAERRVEELLHEIALERDENLADSPTDEPTDEPEDGPTDEAADTDPPEPQD